MYAGHGRVVSKRLFQVKLDPFLLNIYSPKVLIISLKLYNFFQNFASHKNFELVRRKGYVTQYPINTGVVFVPHKEVPNFFFFSGLQLLFTPKFIPTCVRVILMFQLYLINLFS